MKKVINSGCGFENPERLPPIFRNATWQEIRVDINPLVEPDVITSCQDLSHFASDSVDAVYSSHNLEHLYQHEAHIALTEFVRVLNPEGFAIITLPDLKKVAQLVVDDQLESPAYVSKMGPISAMDILFGHRESIQQGNEYMAHKSGYTIASLGKMMLDAGFREVRIKEGKNFDIWAVGIVQEENSQFFDNFHYDQLGL